MTAGIAFGAAACNDPNENTGLLPTAADTLTVYALTGTAPSFPSGYRSVDGAVTRVDGSFNFDIAFDINAEGAVVIYPQRLVGVSAVGAKPVGIQRFFTEFATDWPGLMAATFLMSVPVVVLFLVLQKYFVRALTEGAVKH